MSTAASVAIPFALLALLLPVPGYVWALHDAAIGLKTSRRSVRFTVVGLVAVGLSLVGFHAWLGFLCQWCSGEVSMTRLWPRTLQCRLAWHSLCGFGI